MANMAGAWRMITRVAQNGVTEAAGTIRKK